MSTSPSGSGGAPVSRVLRAQCTTDSNAVFAFVFFFVPRLMFVDVNGVCQQAECTETDHIHGAARAALLPSKVDFPPRLPRLTCTHACTHARILCCALVPIGADWRFWQSRA